jgi:mannose-6-phosphate isomerase
VLIKITNTARDYAWGSRTLISDYFGTQPTGQPMAEIWFGTHPGSAATVAESGESLPDAIGHQLSFLLKILAAESPLSIQAHPNAAQAKAGFDRENAAGIELTANKRNYKDDQHKPEMIVALTEFEALCGFKPQQEIAYLLEDLAQHPSVSDGMHSIAAGWLALFKQPEGLKKLFADILSRRGNLDGVTAELTNLAEFEGQFALAERLNLLYPGDPGVVVALLMNHIYLEPGEALFLPAGNIHAYMSGLGVEVMAASDNVLRGGLTPKHIDVAELESVLDFSFGAVPKVETRELVTGLIEYPAAVDEFITYRAELSGANLLADLNLPGESIFLCTAGEVAISTSLDERLVLRRGEAAYLSGEANKFSLAGSGTCFMATSPKPQVAI